MQRIELGFLRVSIFLPGESARSWGRDCSAELLEVWVGRRKRSASFIRTGPRSLAVCCPGPQCPVTHLEVTGWSCERRDCRKPKCHAWAGPGWCVAVAEVFALCARSTFLEHHAA